MHFPMITASVGVDSSLLLEPAHELLFPLPDATATHRPRCCLTLTNLSPLNDVVFRVRTRNPDAFSVRPTHGLLAPGASAQVIVAATARTCERLGAMDPRDLMTRQSSELFLVQSVEREQAKELVDASSSSSLRNFWKEVARDSVTENKMVCRFAGGTSTAAHVTQDNDLFSRSMSNTSMSSQESRSGRDEHRALSMSARESRSSHDEHRTLSMSTRESRSSRSGSSSERSRLDRSFSNQFTPPEVQRRERRSGNQSFSSDASFYTTIEAPAMDRRSEARLSASSTGSRVSRTPTTRRDSVLTSISVRDSSVSDTMLSAKTSFSTDTAAGDPTHHLGPLQYHIEPSDVVSFDVKPAPRFWGSTSLFVVNSSQRDCLVFKVRTSNQSGYAVKPSRGLVSTTNAQEVIISLCAPRDESSFDLVKREAKDGFMIEVANISRDKYVDLMKLDERKRTRELSSLWSLLSRSDRQSTMLSVELKTGGSESGSGTRDSSESGYSISASFNQSSKTHKPPRKSVHSVVNGMKQLLTCSSTDESPESVADERQGSTYRNSDESVFTIAPSVAPSEVDKDESENDVVAYTSAANKPHDSAVIVVSADRMDTVDFSNPKLSFFI